jgi:beta-lactam-binding protein with PASTA domain
VSAEPGETVLVTLTLRNAGSAMDRYEPDVPMDAGGRMGVDRAGFPDVYAGEQRVWTIVYTVPSDGGDDGFSGAGTGVGAGAGDGRGAFGLGGIDSGGGSAFEEPAERFPERVDVSVRVGSVADVRVAACAVFSVRVVAAGQADGFAPVPTRHDVGDSYGDDDDRRGGGDGNRKVRIAGATIATVVAVVLAVLVGMAVAKPGDDKKPAAKNAVPTSMPEASGAATGASASASAESESAAATPSTSATATPSPSATAAVTVPNVVGMTQAQGLAALRDKGFRPTVVGTGDKIASTDPAPGKKVDRAKTSITVTLSATPATSSPPPSTGAANPPDAKVSVPGVANMTYAQAEARLTDQGFTVARVDEISADAAAGTVLRTNPGDGAMVVPGTKVTVTVAKADDTMTVVPRIYDRYMPDAIATLQAAGLSFKPPYDVARDYQRMCRLSEFTPAEGTRVRKGSTITVLRVVGCG